MTTRPPLSTAKHDNLPRKSADAVHRDPEGKLRKALASLVEERRKRAEVEGEVDALRRDKDSSRQVIDGAKQELGLAQAEIKAQRATILRLSAATASSTTLPQRSEAPLEGKLQDLVEKHTSAKAKYSAEIADLKSVNTSLQSLVSALQSFSTTDKQTITDLRGERAKLRAEVEALKSRPQAVPARDDKAEEWSRFKEERQVWRKEKMAMEEEAKTLKRQAGDMGGLQRECSEMREKCEGLEEMLDAATRAYAVRYYTTVSEAEYHAVKDELEVERSAARVTRSQLAVSRVEARRLLGENTDLREEIQVLREQVERTDSDLTHLLEHRHMDRQQAGSPRTYDTSGASEAISDETDLLQMLDIALSHIALSSSHTSDQTSLLLSSISSLRTELDNTAAHLVTSRTDLSALQSTHAATRAELDAMLSAHSDCADQLLHWRGEASRSGATEARLKSTLHDVSEKLREVEERARGEREMLKRANEGSARWAAARLALEDEVASLRLALIDTRGLEHRYQLLEDEAEILRSREAMAADEAERLGVQNAELIGHTNGVQKISYVEGLRREMALVKHELATARHHLNLCSTQITELQAEVNSYKSITPSLLSASTGLGRVRVARRHAEPEGGEVVRSSVVRRSVPADTRT